MTRNRKNIFLAWIVFSVIVSAAFSMISMLYWEFTYIHEPNVDWSPIDDTTAMFLVMPLGWGLSIFSPAGWLSLFGLGIALYKISYKPLIVSVFGAALFGSFWPKIFVALMGI